jgi:hypothetical protein
MRITATAANATHLRLRDANDLCNADTSLSPFAGMSAGRAHVDGLRGA